MVENIEAQQGVELTPQFWEAAVFDKTIIHKEDNKAYLFRIKLPSPVIMTAAVYMTKMGSCTAF